jgi:hypothetical protein
MDVLSRRMFAVQVRSKASGHMKIAIRKLIKQMPALPKRVFSDQGKEFVAREVRQMLEKDYNVHQNVAQEPAIKAAIAERAVKTLKNRLYKYFTEHKTARYIDVLPKIVDAINNSISRPIKMKPINVNFFNSQEIRERLYGGDPPSKKSKLEEGDTVRIAKQRTVFSKAYLPNYTDEVFKIDKVKNVTPNVYRLINEEGQKVTGNFYDAELSRTKKTRDKTLIIEEVLKTRKRRGVKEFFVKFEGRPPEEASWISQADLL